MKDDALPLNSNMLLYSNLLPVIRKVACDHGYAVGVHGSMVNDLDLMLMPWVDDIRPVHTCIVAIAKACGGFIPNGHQKAGDKWVVSEQPGAKPHDRFSWTIAFGGRAYLDISVIVPSESPATKRGEEIPCSRCGYMTFSGSICNKCGAITITKESPCSSGSQGGGTELVVPLGGTSGSTPGTGNGTDTAKPTSTPLNTSNASTVSVASNPPAWATPQILAACKPGERLYLDARMKLIRAHPSSRVWERNGHEHGKYCLPEQACKDQRHECYTVPTPPAECDGSRMIRRSNDDMAAEESPFYLCRGCFACKPDERGEVKHGN